MPDNPSPFDDPFADLYGKLPDSRGRDTDAAPAPTSRRAAREARQTTEPTPTPAPEPIPTPVAATTPTSQKGPAPAQQSSTPVREGEPQRAPDARAAGASLEDLFAGKRSTEQIGAPPPPKNKRRRRAAGWIAFGVVVALLGGISLGGLWVWTTYEEPIRSFMGWEEPKDFEAGLANGETTITVSQGDSGAQVSQKMFDAGVTKTADALYDYIVDNGVAFTFQPGVFRLQLQMTSAAALDALGNPENRLENTAQLREGLTVDTTIAAISEQMAMPLEELQAATADPSAYGIAAQNLEGWLFPATYTFDQGVTATDVIQRMIDRTIQSLDTAGVPVDQRERVLTVASIIEREGRTNDFPRVSRVIQNRIDQGMKLQMDSTAQYGYGELHAGSASTSAEAQFDDNPWNTYVIDGLPVTPIANPGDAAIAAAMSPEEGPWLFFVTVNLDTGETVFTTNADDHQAAVDQWIEWCRDNPDSGC
jgi:UPF0755 protein